MKNKDNNENNTFEESKNFNEFINWRTEKIKKYETMCAVAESSFIETSPFWKDFLKNFPRCMIHLTREMCGCDSECLSKSFRNFNLDTSCIEVDHNNLFLSLKYLPCDIYGIKIIDGEMYKSDKNVSTNAIGKRITNAIENICDGDQQNFNKLQCAAYELKNECLDDIECFNDAIIPNVPYKCSNPEFEDQINEVENSIDFPTLGLNFVQFENNESGGNRIVRSVDNRNEIFMNDVETERMPIDSMRNNSNSALKLTSPTIFFMSAILISAVGFVSFKIFKKFYKKDNSGSQRIDDIKI